MKKVTKTTPKKKAVTKKASVRKVAPKKEEEYVLVLRTCGADMTSYNGFKWPTSGPVECPDWSPKPQCGNGLHGLLWGEGDWALLSDDMTALWQVVRVLAADVVSIDERKVKFPRGEVLYTGSRAKAMTGVLCAADNPRFAKADETSRVDLFNISSGNCSTAASSGYGSTAASSGNYSTAASSGDDSTAASSGYETIAIVAGYSGAAQAGPNGCIALTWYDGKRPRITVGYVGEDGIEADTMYRCDQTGKLVKA